MGIAQMLRGLSNYGRKVGQFLSSAVEEAVEPDTAYESVTKLQPDYSEHVFRTDYGITQSAKSKWSRMKYVNRDKRITQRLYQRAVKTMDTEYRTVVKIRGVNERTGERVTRHIPIGHDTIRERGEIEEAGARRLEAAGSPISIEEIRPVGGVRSA